MTNLQSSQRIELNAFPSSAVLVVAIFVAIGYSTKALQEPEVVPENTTINDAEFIDPETGIPIIFLLQLVNQSWPLKGERLLCYHTSSLPEITR